MAEVAGLARHLFMTEVLEICENVHKQMEDKQITVYQKGDVQIVEVAQNLSEQNENEETPIDKPEAPLPAEDAVATVNGTCSSTEVKDVPMPEAALQSTSEPLADKSSTPVLHSPNLKSTENEVKAQTVECITNQPISVEQSELPAPEQVVISTQAESGTDQNASTEQNISIEQNVNSEANTITAAEDSQEGLKRKRGRPCKAQCSPPSQSETSVSSQDDTYKSKLRQRSVSEGGYIKLHKGTEKKLQTRKAGPKSAIQQVC